MRAAFSEKFEKKIEESTLFKKIAVRVFALSVSIGIVASVAGQSFFIRIHEHFPGHSVVPFVLIILISIFIGSICAFSVFYMVILRVKQILHELSNDSPNWEKLESEYMESDIRDLYLAIRKLHGIVSNQSKIFGIAHTARQVAHDIRSPLAALQVMSQYLGELPEEKRVLIRSAVQRINDIANDLGGKKIADGKEKTSDDLVSVQLLSSLIESLVSEKRLQFRSRLGVKIESDLDNDSYGLFAKIQPVEFKRVLSNLINNAVEAMDSKGQVVLSLRAQRSNPDCHGPGGPRNDRIEIIVSDNGKGIPAEILPRLMQKGVTFGKENDKQSGSGLGLYHARESLKIWGGDIQLKSELGIGTKVILNLPKEVVPSWFVSEIKITEKTQIVILDDDSSIHHVWDGKLLAAKVRKENIFHFTTTQDVMKFTGRDENLSAIFLFDYELLGSKTTGLDVIEKLGIAEQSILVTSRFEEENVRERCGKLKVKLLPKNLAGFVPIIFENRDDNKSDAEYILIDDEEINRSTWDAVAKIQGKRLATFSTAEVFLERIRDFDKNVRIYIDSHLGENVRGEAIAKIIHRKGFEQIYLCTGSSPTEFPAMPWIKDIVDKVPPFIKQ